MGYDAHEPPVAAKGARLRCPAAAADEAIPYVVGDCFVGCGLLAMTAVVSVLAHAARRHGILAMTG